MTRYSSLRFLFLCVFSALFATGCSVFEQKPVDVGSGEVKVTVPSSIKVIAVDTREVNAPSLYRGNYHVRMAPGIHTLLVQYVENWNTMDESGYIIKSEAIEIRSDFAAGTEYRIDLTTPQSRREAQQWVLAPDVRLASAKGEVKGHEIKGPVITTAADTDVVESLQALWQASTPEDRQRFRDWLETQQ
ncbi:MULTISPECIES: DUF2057 family protein [unclassified Thalassolituus]|uniref:DUF2057 family protein n=1 Tax=unclassified Thalassolituus TaxID=2624967 RepID=UPI0025E6C6CF|nr:MULTISPECIES: DUF2057 family protein [unclassified Thalassolituus]|tara:strand:- start:3498 stop:4064 length:567 start_codon:yes stop_codon:yes gene_type:complete